jgi:adenylate kinase family enzyme
MMRSVVINLFAGPGAGKSTTAARLFSSLKLLGKNAELVQEFAKGAVWEKRSQKLFACQPYITGKQIWQQARLADEVEFMVSDSPILLGLAYISDDEPSEYKSAFQTVLLHEFNRHTNINFFIKRAKAYNPKGRNQTEQEAIEKDNEVKAFLNSLNIPFIEISGDASADMQIIDHLILKGVINEVNNGNTLHYETSPNY